MSRPRKWGNDAERKRAWKRAHPVIVLDPAHEQPIIVPPEVRKAQERRIAFVTRAIEMGRITPNQLILGEPVKTRSVSSSLSTTEIYALLGPWR